MVMDYTKPLPDDVISVGAEKMRTFIAKLPVRSFANPANLDNLIFPEWIVPILEPDDQRIFARGSTSVLFSLGTVQGIPLVGKIEYSDTRNSGLSTLDDDSVILLTGRWVMGYLIFYGYLENTIFSLNQLGFSNIAWQKEIALNVREKNSDSKFPCSFQITYDLSENGKFKVYDYEEMPTGLKNQVVLRNQYTEQLKKLREATGNSKVVSKSFPYALRSAGHGENPLERMFIVRVRDYEGELILGDLNHLGIYKRAGS
jgi:hypothetical protein